MARAAHQFMLPPQNENRSPNLQLGRVPNLQDPEAANPQDLTSDAKLTRFLRRVTGPRFLAVCLAVLVLVILALGAYIAVLKSSQCPCPQANATDEASRAENAKNGEVLPPCGDEWIWFRNKCYFFSENETNWDDAKHACASWNSSLAVIENQREMTFAMRYKGQVDHWIGSKDTLSLPRASSVSNPSPIPSQLKCRYINMNGIATARCHGSRNWICAHRPHHAG